MKKRKEEISDDEKAVRVLCVFCVLLAQFGMLLACWYDGYEYHREGRLKEH